MKAIKEIYLKYREIIDYLFWGVMTTVVSWGSYAVFADVFDLSITVSNILSWIFAVIFAFFVNKIFVFLSKDWSPKIVLRECALFVSTRLGTGLLEIVLVPLLVKVGMDQTIFGVKGAVAKVVGSIVVVLLNYVFSKKMIFTKKDGE